MPEFRKDPVIGRWVIIATDRAKRPSDFVREPTEPRKGFCPFCSGNEHYTPPEILAYRHEGTRANAPGWWVRVVPNKYPALQVEGNLDRAADGMYDRMNGIGAHEVIIEHPDHQFSLAYGDPGHVASVIAAWRSRMLDLKRDSRFQYAMIFKNHGREAGASLEHPHTQLIAIPNVPKRVHEELLGGRKYFEWRERCVFCDIISQEIQTALRVVMENHRFIAIEPYAARFPFETWILPKRHATRFETIGDDEALDLARILSGTLGKLQRALDHPPYNFLIHNGPWNDDELPHYHWHLEIIPKLANVAGFEWGSGFYINPTPPESAAAFLREAERQPETRSESDASAA